MNGDFPDLELTAVDKGGVLVNDGVSAWETQSLDA
jgi:hypothetical protein